MTTAIVTGVAGFIGSHVAEKCVALGMRVIGIDNLSGGIIENIPAEVRFKKADILDTDEINRIFEEYKPDYVYHLAAYAAEGLSHFIRRYNYQVNVVGSMNLINAAIRHQVRAFIFTSSIAVYGDSRETLSENSSLAPIDPYGIAKLAVELDLNAAYNLFKMPFVIFRPHNVYGERQNFLDGYRNVVSIFISKCCQGMPLPIFGDGNQQRAFTYIDDVSSIIAESGPEQMYHGRILNIGSQQLYSVNDLAKIISRICGRELKTKSLPPRMEAEIAHASSNKLIQLIGSRPIISLEDGLKKTIDWYRSLDRPAGIKFEPKIELYDNLPWDSERTLEWNLESKTLVC